MAKSFEGLSKTDPRGLELAGQESPGEPLLTAGEGGAPPGLRGCWRNPARVSPPSLCVCIATPGDSAPFLFHSQGVADGEWWWGRGVLMVSVARDTRPRAMKLPSGISGLRGDEGMR